MVSVFTMHLTLMLVNSVSLIFMSHWWRFFMPAVSIDFLGHLIQQPLIKLSGGFICYMYHYYGKILHWWRLYNVLSQPSVAFRIDSWIPQIYLQFRCTHYWFPFGMFAIDGVCPTSSLMNTKGNSAGEKNNEYKNMCKNNTPIKI